MTTAERGRKSPSTLNPTGSALDSDLTSCRPNIFLPDLDRSKPKGQSKIVSKAFEAGGQGVKIDLEGGSPCTS